MGKLLVELLKQAAKLLRRPRPPAPPPRPPRPPRDAGRQADRQGNPSRSREDCGPRCEAGRGPQPRNTQPYANRLRGRKFEEAEEILDRELRDEAGWTKGPLRQGDGVRYYDGKGNGVQLNRGYPEGLRGGGGDAVHRGPYVKIQPSLERVPLGQ